MEYWLGLEKPVVTAPVERQETAERRTLSANQSAPKQQQSDLRKPLEMSALGVA